MADGAHTRQMSLQDMVQQLKEMNAQQAELKGEIGDMIGDMFSEMKADLLGILKQALKLPEQTTVTNPNPFVETVTNPDPFVETVKNSDPLIDSLKRASVLQVPDFVTDVLIVHKMDSHVKDVEEFTQQSTNDNGKNIALQVFDEMPLRVTSKEKQRKSLKAWRFKFKPTSKRSKLMDDMLSFVEETAWLNKDPKETIWDCIKKEFKETMAACGKKTIDRLKLVDETSKPAVYDGPIQIRVWESGGSPLERVSEESSGDAKFHLKQSHDSVENYLGSFEYALTRSSLQHMPTNQYRAPFNPYQSYNDQPLDNTRHNNLSNEMAASLGLVGGDDQEDDMKFARKKIVKKNNSETKIEFSSSDHSCFVALDTTSNLHKDTLSLPKDFTTSNGVKRECREIVLTDKGDKAWSLELRFNRVGNGEILVLSLCPAEKASKESFLVKVMHRINQMNEAGYSPNEKIVYTLTYGLYQAKRDHEAIRVLRKLIQLEFSLNLLDCSSLTGLFCEPKLEVEVTVLLKGNMNIKRTTFFGRNVVKWKCWLVMGSRLPLHNWVALRKLIVWEVLCLLQNDVHRLLQSFSELKQRIIVSLWKSLGYLMEAHGSKYEGLVCVFERKKLRNIEDDINHLKRLLATMEGLAQKISCGLLCGDGKFHLKNKWRSRLLRLFSEVEVDMLKQWVLQVVFQQSKQRTEKLWVLNEPMIGTGFSLMKNIESLKEHEQLEDAAKGIRSYESNIGHVEKSLTEFSVYGVFHLQRPPELG